ncbi:EamA family transporter [Rhizobium sp. BK491]|uniref:EamA family transporter n=1 Tax=Rhizobium sp. BK491 TaxID=2587009 RepID=UPI0016150170|nr:EamA family transporter [Rhizobium sp. BK491]MBB3571904.1 drug/metabolite transporter (DMT)-like permease [Rhizobium sp. BK491]
MMLSRTHITLGAAFAAIYIIWGSTYLALALGLQTLPPFLLMGIRCLIGGTILYAYARVRSSEAPSATMWGVAAVCGLLFFVGCHGVLAYAQQRVPSGVAALLLATIPFWIVLLQAFIPGGERPTGMRAALLVPGIAGVALIAWQEISSGASAVHPVDLILLLGASFSWAVGTVISERHSAKFASAGLSGIELLAGGVALAVISALSGELEAVQPTRISAVSLGGLAYLILFGTVIAFAAYTWLLRRISPLLVATYTFINPIIAVAIGYTFLGESVTTPILVGAAMIVVSVAGMLLLQYKSTRKDGTPHFRETAVSQRRL